MGGAGYYLIKKVWLFGYFWQPVLLKMGWCRDLHGSNAGMIPKSAKCSIFLDIVSAERFWKLKAFSLFCGLNCSSFNEPMWKKVIIRKLWND